MHAFYLIYALHVLPLLKRLRWRRLLPLPHNFLFHSLRSLMWQYYYRYLSPRQVCAHIKYYVSNRLCTYNTCTSHLMKKNYQIKWFRISEQAHWVLLVTLSHCNATKRTQFFCCCCNAYHTNKIQNQSKKRVTTNKIYVVSPLFIRYVSENERGVAFIYAATKSIDNFLFLFARLVALIAVLSFIQ